MNPSFDITVIGSGPGGYIAAIRAAQLGYKTALIEKYPALGGTCTNVGCIPSKALLDSTEHFYTARNKFETHGISISALNINFNQLIKRKDEVVLKNNKGIEYLIKKNKITLYNGIGSFVDTHTVSIHSSGKETININSRNFIIATGSKPSALPGLSFDKKRIISSTEALSLSSLPKSMVIIGGGVIGVEMASIYSRIGTKITIIEYADSLIPQMDRELGNELKKILKKQGIDILLSHQVKEAINDGQEVSVKCLDQYGQQKNVNAEYCLVAVGRKPFTEGLGLEKVGIKTDTSGRIIVNKLLQTSSSNIYAIGDVIEGPMLAHKAEEEGIFVVESIHGKTHKINYGAIPGVVYTWPEVAAVGYTEEQLNKEGIEYRKGKFPFSALARSRASMDTEGFVKVLSEPKYGEILGVHIIGPRAADLIAQAVVGLQYEVTDDDMYRMSYAHPTYAEALKEAYLQASGQGALNL